MVFSKKSHTFNVKQKDIICIFCSDSTFQVKKLEGVQKNYVDKV